MLRGLLKTGTAWALYGTAAGPAAGRAAGADPAHMVIGYHRVVEDFPTDPYVGIPSQCVSIAMLEKHLDWIGKRFRFVTLDELGARMEWGEKFQDRVVAVTFDDGYAGVYEHAFPLLQKKGIPATVFVNTALVGTSCIQIHDRLYLLLIRAFSKWGSDPRVLLRFFAKLEVAVPRQAKNNAVNRDPHGALEFLLGCLPQAELMRVIAALEEEVSLAKSVYDGHRMMTWDMVREMHDSGVVTIGSHTHSHALLPVEGREKVAAELADSRFALQQRLGVHRVRHFAYPCGYFNPETVQAVAHAGYRFGYGVCLHRDSSFPLLTIPRKLLWERSCLDAQGEFSPAVLSCQLDGAFDLLTRCGINHAGGRRLAVLRPAAAEPVEPAARAA